MEGWGPSALWRDPSILMVTPSKIEASNQIKAIKFKEWRKISNLLCLISAIHIIDSLITFAIIADKSAVHICISMGYLLYLYIMNREDGDDD